MVIGMPKLLSRPPIDVIVRYSVLTITNVVPLSFRFIGSNNKFLGLLGDFHYSFTNGSQHTTLLFFMITFFFRHILTLAADLIMTRTSLLSVFFCILVADLMTRSLLFVFCCLLVLSTLTNTLNQQGTIK